ncbi:hypothetical protein XENOCAPTIV_001186, partial [Xenoophorus captivus]
VLYLQYGGETKKVVISTEISSENSLRSLFVTAFPHQLTMKMLLPPNMAVCIKDTNRNVYHDLEDLRDITPYSCLKAYHRNPGHVFSLHARPTNPEGKVLILIHIDATFWLATLAVSLLNMLAYME